jgi:hypothetical protein
MTARQWLDLTGRAAQNGTAYAFQTGCVAPERSDQTLVSTNPESCLI